MDIMDLQEPFEQDPGVQLSFLRNCTEMFLPFENASVQLPKCWTPSDLVAATTRSCTLGLQVPSKKVFVVGL